MEPTAVPALPSRDTPPTTRCAVFFFSFPRASDRPLPPLLPSRMKRSEGRAVCDCGTQGTTAALVCPPIPVSPPPPPPPTRWHGRCVLPHTDHTLASGAPLQGWRLWDTMPTCTPPTAGRSSRTGHATAPARGPGRAPTPLKIQGPRPQRCVVQAHTHLKRGHLCHQGRLGDQWGGVTTWVRRRGGRRGPRGLGRPPVVPRLGVCSGQEGFHARAGHAEGPVSENSVSGSPVSGNPVSGHPVARHPVAVAQQVLHLTVQRLGQ